MRSKPMFGGRAFWLRQMRQWHWISAAICLIGMLLFAVTGITLNHASQIEAAPKVRAQVERLPDSLLQQIRSADSRKADALPHDVLSWVEHRFAVDLDARKVEWSADEIYISLPRPGGDGWISIDRERGDVRYEVTDRGWISYLNDLHKGRHTGLVWSWFLDVFAIACVVFCVTGLLLLQLLAAQRPSTWPLVGLGLIVPLLLAILFIH